MFGVLCCLTEIYIEKDVCGVPILKKLLSLVPISVFLFVDTSKLEAICF